MQEIISKHKKSLTSGIFSVCSAHPKVIEALFLHEQYTSNKVLIEATSNQVNQFGGYTGMKPINFIDFVKKIAKQSNFDVNRIIFGGDHLGPNCWTNENYEVAMHKSNVLIEEYVKAGFTKIHLDASMPCKGDPKLLSPEIIAARAALMCKHAENIATDEQLEKLGYIIGTEVPVPGGENEELTAIHISKKDDIKQTIDLHLNEFDSHGITHAKNKILGIVVQPGVEFDHSKVFDYDKTKTKEIVNFISQTPWVYEAHSTDYQSKENLRDLVHDSFAILKVGPALTFAFREAILSLASIEDILMPEHKKSNLINVLIKTLLNNPQHWDKYYRGNFDSIRQQLLFSLSDRIRYYWTDSTINESLTIMLKNLQAIEIPMSLISQFFPLQYKLILSGKFKNNVNNLVLSKIQDVLADYSYACTSG
ncbi:class II D-tagatose-bisphosphate aldolase, non-catalytic subunit [Thorsellia anophelis]|uniref:D-tagatose-1,6-bisphosphate aldolase subunit GatZ/KbaZ n=1 Tax=Thorsellia anophelis DSM 18579 TaxID=1123402 RepID=A0A1I0F1G1_9GAMM|nr:class II D-tagatose-bisphosphate aldolase, non-catalytic subunit [Thorsellia anophelis]SET50840.1 D-tagatose-1,6-bisphosphate aldolase subunit GatZ/KbaZ [Thorsellia anophelis DSM 18579]